MVAYVTSIGELTEETCVWSLQRLGFEVVLIKDSSTSLWEKLKLIYYDANDDFLRVDADLIVNKNIKGLVEQNELWWYQGLQFDWYKLDVGYGMNFIRKEAIPFLREHVDESKHLERPETYMYRIDSFHNPRRCGNYDVVCGLHGFANKDIKRVIETKVKRGQQDLYDWELVERINELWKTGA